MTDATSNDNPVRSNGPKIKQTNTVQPVEVKGSVVLASGTFDPHKPVLIDQAEQLFRKQIAETHGDSPLRNVTLKGVTHHVGTSVTYEFIGQVG